MKVLILAGGFATRLWPLTEKRAKPLLLLNGKTILAHLLEKIPEKFEVILLTNKKFERDFIKELKLLKRNNFRIFCEDAFADGDKLGALGAISAVIQNFKINENICVFAGDNILPNLKIESLFCEDGEAKLAVFDVKDFFVAQNFGVVEIDKNNQLVRFEEKPKNPKSTLVSTGFCAISQKLFSILHNFAQKNPDALGGIFEHFLEKEIRVNAKKVGGEWFDVGHFNTYLAAHKEIQKESLKLSNKVVQEQNKYSGKVFIGEGAVVKNCQILNSIIYPKVRLENCHISESVIDEDCELSGVDLNRKLVRRGTKLCNIL
jgi:glucose-1-phosphate thymidylyltransferase